MSVKSLLGGLEELPANIPESFTMDEDTEKSPQKLQSEGASLIDQLLSDSNGVSSSNSEDGSNDDDDDDDDDVDDESEDEGEGEEGNEDDDADSNEDDEGSEEEEGKNEESTMDIDEESNSLDKITAEFEREKIDETKISAQRSTVAPDIQQADDELSNIEATPQKGKKRKRKKAAPGEKKKKKKSKKSKPGNLRRNIRDIMKEDELDADTVAAQKEEAERRRRLLEVKKALEQKMKEREEKDSQLKSLLQDESKGDEVILLDSSDEGRSRVKSTRELSPVPSADTSTGDNDVIELSSDEEDDEEDDDDDSSTTKDEDIDLESEDPNNAGSHINDEINVPDDQGRVLVNIGHSADEEDIFLAPQIAKHIKRHQIGGVRFLYDNLIESLTRYKSSPGFGCILAHSMGLGKTIQMISFIEIFLRCANAKTVLLIVPINTLQNWMNEFNTWCPSKEMIGENNLHVITRSFDVFMLNENFKTTSTRAKVIDKWYQTGGVLLMGYEMYRLLSSRRGHIADKMKKPGRKPANPVVIDVEEEFKNKGLLVGVHEALINPGPDLIVCDEGHRIKNSQAGISQSLKNIKTKRRVVLTGYPLQNNLMEYWCMVDFVRPNYLGTKTEFSNMFERPINNGQCHDSTMSDEKLMRYRAHVLHSLLEGFVQRRGHTVLRDALPPKQEYIFLIRMSPIQRSLYKEFMESLMGAGLGTWANNNPLKAFAVCCKIWNHPDILYNLLNKRNAGTDDNDLDIETEGGPAKKPKAPKKPRVPQPVDAYYPPSDRNQEISYDWAKELMKDYMSGLLESGGKMVILFKLIEESLAQNDKLLVFSQSLFTLDLIEEFLSKYKVPRPDMDENWCKNRSYFRLDGSTASQEREKLINQFNAPDNNKSWLFLLSTRAGSLGVNLVGANRVVVVDASWNPCHDCQAICRVYRFGQVKPSYIYRLVTDNTMEKRIYDRQVTKQGMSNRVVDEMQVQNHFTRRQVDNLLQYEDQDFDEIDFNTAAEEFDDPVMVNVLRKEGKWLTRRPFEHESLLIDKKELRLTKKEKQLAKQSYVMEKRLNVSYTRPSYAAFYPKGTEPIRRQTVKIVNPPHMASWPSAYPGRPIASVKPMITTPVPMQIKKDGIRPGVQLVSKNKPGVTVHKVITTTDIMLPGTNTSTQAGAKPEPNRITAGQQIFIIKTPKGVYIRTATGKIFAVRAKFPLLQGLGAAEISTSSTSVSTVIVTASTTSSTFSTDSRSEMHTSGTTTVTTSSTTSTVMLSSIITDTIKRQDSSSSLTSALSAADLLKDSEPETRSQSLTGEETVELSKPAEPNTEMSSTEKLKPTVPETEVQISQIPSSEQRKTELSNAEEVELDTMPGKISKSDSTMTPPSTVSNSSRYQKIAPNLASFGAQLTSDINETISNQQMMSDNMSSVDTRLDEESNTPNLNSFTAQLAAASDPKMSSNYTNYGTSMGSNNDRMPGHPYHMQNMNQNSMMSPWYQNQMMYNSNPPSYTNTTQNPSPYNNASNMQSEQSSGTMQNMHQNSMGDMSNSSMQNMGMTGMPTMSPMSMQHSMMGFPFAPYPFPMPQPYLMGGIDPGYMPHMPMGQGTGGYMPQGMGMPHNMGMGVPQNTINMSSYHHGNGGSMSNTMNAFRENSNGSQQ